MENSLSVKVNQKVIELGGRTWNMDFNMQALSIAEEIYFTEYGRNANVNAIMSDLVGGKLTAVMAFAYGAMRAAGERLTWREFSQNVFTWEHFDPLFELVSAAILALFVSGDEDKEAVAEGGEKNGATRGRR